MPWSFELSHVITAELDVMSDAFTFRGLLGGSMTENERSTN